MSFPTSIDSFTDPSPRTPTNSTAIPLATAISQLNEAVNSIETVIGITGSADPASIENRLSSVVSQSGVSSVAGRTGAVTLAVSDVTNAVATSDARLSDSRTPTAHASSHAQGGSDVLTATAVPFTASGNIAATNVQAALEELDSEKLAATVAAAGSLISGASQKTALISADKIAVSDSAASNALKYATPDDLATYLYTLGIPRVLWRSGIPFVIFAGDGGSNGLTFTGTRGQFTLSAAILSGIYAMLPGFYTYMPAGAGGLSAGWYWATMSNDTTGEIYADTYTPGSGTPAWVSSPTNNGNLSAGRITQSTSEITAVSFTMPGGSMGPNGLFRALWKFAASSSGNNKTMRIKAGGTAAATEQWTTSNLCTDGETIQQNTGIQTKQIGNRPWVWLGYSAISTYLGDAGTVDFSTNQTVLMSLQLASNVDSMIGILRSFETRYGA